MKGDKGMTGPKGIQGIEGRRGKPVSIDAKLWQDFVVLACDHYDNIIWHDVNFYYYWRWIAATDIIH